MQGELSVPGKRRFAVAAERGPLFYSVAEVAALFKMSPATVYRAIRDDEFPAVKIRGRFIVPAKAVNAMAEAAADAGTTVDASAWVTPNGASHG